MKPVKLKGNFSLENIKADFHRLKCFFISDKTNSCGIQLLADTYSVKLSRTGGNYFRSTKLYVDENAVRTIKDFTKELKPVR